MACASIRHRLFFSLQRENIKTANYDLQRIVTLRQFRRDSAVHGKVPPQPWLHRPLQDALRHASPAHSASGRRR